MGFKLMNNKKVSHRYVNPPRGILTLADITVQLSLILTGSLSKPPNANFTKIKVLTIF